MKWMKKMLGLPNDHFWIRKNWADFRELGGERIAADLGLAPGDVEPLLQQNRHEDSAGGPRGDVEDLHIFKAVLATHNQRDAMLLRGMVLSVFGKSPEDSLAALISFDMLSAPKTCCKSIAVSL